MAFQEMSSPIPEINPEDQPDILADTLLRNFVADLTPRKTTPGMDMWAELRYRATGEINYPRWSETFLVDEARHTVALYGVQGEMPDGREYFHSALRCSCCLPDHKSFRDMDDEYHECPAQNTVIDERVSVYRELVGSEKLGRLSDKSLHKAAVFLLELISRDHFAWPPSNRSDRLLVDPMAKVFDVPKARMRAGVEELAHDRVVQLHGSAHPSISLAA